MAKEKIIADTQREENDLDGCDVEFQDADATQDDELPRAVGGVAIADEGDETDGCEVDFDDVDATPDEELPASVGGVA